MNDLKQCPFCGGDGYVARRILPHGFDPWYGCGCKKCRVQFGCYKSSKKEAIEQWNTRVIE